MVIAEPEPMHTAGHTGTGAHQQKKAAAQHRPVLQASSGLANTRVRHMAGGRLQEPRGMRYVNLKFGV